MNLVVIGTGYVGLVTGVGFASLGNSVSFVDLDENKVSKLKDKQVPFYEPGLDELLIKNNADLFLDLDWFYYNDKEYLNYRINIKKAKKILTELFIFTRYFYNPNFQFLTLSLSIKCSLI